VEATLVPLDPKNARAALNEACSLIGLDPTDAELIRLGENAVFRLRTSPVVARVARDPSQLADADRLVRVARWLADSDVPAVRALDVEQPIRVAARVVTLWESVSDSVEYGTTAELGQLLRRLHALAAPADISLPLLEPFARAEARLRRVGTLTDVDRRFLLDRSGELADAFCRLEFVLPVGPVHGDANVGNVFRDDHGRAVLGDLDGIAVGPREWDLVLTAMYFERYGWHTDREYRNFVGAYGYDVMAWSGYPILRDVRELLMVAWLAQNAHEPQVAAELTKRVEALRTGRSRRDWRPF
jgi:Ser/Thr protein kinase RdoA (MazF antagonist)